MNLLCSEAPGSEAALHFNPRLDESAVVFNTLEQGTWGQEERGSGIPFQHGHPFDMLLIATEEGFKVGPCHPQAWKPGRLLVEEGSKGVAMLGRGFQRPPASPGASPLVSEGRGAAAARSSAQEPVPRGWGSPSGARVFSPTVCEAEALGQGRGGAGRETRPETRASGGRALQTLQRPGRAPLSAGAAGGPSPRRA